MVESGSSVPRRQLGRQLRQAHEEAGITLEAAVQELEWSRAKMYRIEGGQAPMRKHDVLAMCTFYRTPSETTTALVGLAAQSKVPGWWHAYADTVSPEFIPYLGLEPTAAHIRHYALAFIPGLLQTPEYATAVIRSRRGITEAELEQAVAVRMRRQRVLTRRIPQPPKLEVVLEEGVLRRMIPGRAAMQRQLAHLINNAQVTGVRVRVLPFASSAQGAVAGSFILMDFSAAGTRPPEPSIVYLEGQTGALYLDRPQEIAAHERTWETLSEQALGEQESEDLIAKVIGEMDDA